MSRSPQWDVANSSPGSRVLLTSILAGMVGGGIPLQPPALGDSYVHETVGNWSGK